MKKHLFQKSLLVLVGVLIVGLTSVMYGQTYKPAVGNYGATYQGASIQSHQMMSGGAMYSGTTYEPFNNTTPSEQSAVGANQAPANNSGPRRIGTPNDGLNQGSESPVGEPWVLLAFAIAFAAVIAIRQRKRNLTKSTNMEKTSKMKHAKKTLLALIAILTLGVGQMWAYTATIYVVPEKTWGNNWSSSKKVKVSFRVKTDGDNQWWGEDELSPSGMYYDGCEIYSKTYTTLPNDGFRELWIKRYNGSTKEDDFKAYADWADCNYWNGHMRTNNWVDLDYTKYSISNGVTIYFDNTDMEMSNVGLYLFKPGYSTTDNFTQISGTPYWERTYSSGWSNYAGIIFKTQSDWTKQTANIYQNISTNTCFTPTSSSNKSSVSTTAPVGPKNIAISNNGTTIIRGTGTEGDPYVVAPGTTISVQASADKIDDNTTLFYKFSTGSSTSYSSSTTTNTVVASAVAGTTYSVTATIKTMLSTNSSREFTTDPLYFTTGYPITFDMEGGTGGPSTMYAVYDKTLANIGSGSFPTKSGNGFDGFWTEDDGKGIQVINEKGEWKANVEYYTGAGGKLIRTEATTLYARWLPVGYYVVGDFNNWTGDPAYHKFDEGSTPYTVSFAILKTNPKLVNLRTPIKIRKVNAGSSSGASNDWYGKNDASEFGKSHTTETGLSTTGSNMTLQVFYNGDYTFNLKTSPTVDLEVLVPVVNQLQIYTNSCDDTKDQYYNWDGEEADDKVTKTLALNRCNFYIKPVWDSYYYGKGTKGGGHTTIDRDHLSATGLGTGDSNEENLKLVADLKGNYTFKYDTVAKSIAVVFPTRYSVSYTVRTQRSGNGTESGANGSLTAVNTDDSNVNISTLSNYVVDGNKVLLTAPSAKSGYEFKGWYKGAHDASDWSKNQITSNVSCTITVAKDTAVYAVYYEPTYTITVDSTSNYVASGNYGGCVKVSGTKVGSVDNVGVNSYAELTAVPTNEAWAFKEWQFTSNASPAATYTVTSNPIQINASAADQTVTAVFQPRYGLVGSRAADGNAAEGMPNNGGVTWQNEYAADFVVLDFEAINTADGVDLECTRTLLPNRQYKFQVYDRALNVRRGCGTKDAVLPAENGGAGVYKNWELNAVGDGNPKDVHIWTVGYGTYTFHITKIGSAATYFPSLQVDRQASHLVTLGWKTTYLTGSDAVSASEGGTVTAETTESGEHFTITNGQYVADGGTVTFTAHPATGYEVKWYKNADYSTAYVTAGSAGIKVDGNTLTISGINGSSIPAPTVYAKFVEKKCRIGIYTLTNSDGTLAIGGEDASWYSANVEVGVHTTATIAVTPITNHYVDSLSKAYNPGAFTYTSYSEAANGVLTATVQATGAASNASIRVMINELDKVYFYNHNASTGGKLWDSDHIYVYYNVYWGINQSQYAGVVPDGGMYAEMSPVYSGSQYYWAYVPRAYMRGNVTSGRETNIAFSDYDFHTYAEFNGYHGVYRGDYNRILNMFVPHRNSENSNNTLYHSNGYWKQYRTEGGEGAGYYFQRLNDSGNGYEQPEQAEFVAIADGSNTLEYHWRVDNTSDYKNRYVFMSAGGKRYIADGTITNSSCTDKNVYENNDSYPYFQLEATVEGEYIFYLKQESDVMSVSVEYPIGPGDYRLEHAYAVLASDGVSDSIVYTHSDVIKARDAAAGQTLSMYLSNGKSKDGYPKLVLQECDHIDGTTKKPVWTAGNSTNLDGVLTELASTGNGVYQFDVRINTTTDQLSEAAFNVDLYNGPYYIKTNCARGMWANYRSNTMSKNTETFDKEKPSTFDYYYCRYVLGGTNVKCVVANEYCNQLSDTLIGDDVIGKNNQALPATSASMRFSYNSYTNEVKRAYLNGSYPWSAEYLLLQGDAKIANTSEVAFTDNKVTLEDHEDYVYIVDIKAKETARARLTANYAGHIQYLIGSDPAAGGATWNSSTEELIGGNAEHNEWNPLRIIYDFKTNHLISAWVANADIEVEDEDIAINTDLMLIRTDQGGAHQITFSGSNKLTDVGTVYGVVRLTKSHVQDHSKSSSEREFYWVSFPFDVDLKQSFGGLGYYGSDWAMEYYDGKTRAKYGYWADSDVNWKIMWKNDTILHAYEGYVLAIELENFMTNYMWPNNTTEIFQYFPSKEPVGNIAMQDYIDVPFPNQDKYYCGINRGTADGDRRVKDSYWHCIGVPGYANATQDIQHDEDYNPGTSTPYVYVWQPSTNEYEVASTDSYTFLPMTSYLVQYSGAVMRWENVNLAPASVAARRQQANEIQECEFKLSLMRNDTELDRTFIRMSNDEGITSGFEFNHDLSKAMNANKANLYTLIGYERVAGNVMPLIDSLTVVPVGVKIVADGEYTFTMPEGTRGVGVTLVDNIIGTRTNLGLTDYTVSLTADKIEDRFSLEISPISQSPTDIGLINGDAEHNASKRIIDGVLYIVKDSKVFDARGQQIK